MDAHDDGDNDFLQFDDNIPSPRGKLFSEGEENVFEIDPLSPDSDSAMQNLYDSMNLLSTSDQESSITGSQEEVLLGPYGEHPLGEHPSRTLFVRNINSNVEDEELKSLFEVSY
jgi:hypothetical protein